MSKPRRLVVGNESLVDGKHYVYGPHSEIDLTGLANASARLPIRAIVQEQCNLGCWHNVSHVDLPCWGSD